MSNLEDLKIWYANLKKSNLDQIENFYDANVSFKDPFNEIKGIEKLRQIFNHMFENLENPHFVFIDTIENEGEIFLTWDFFSKLNEKEYKIHGSTHLKYNEKNRIFYHRDYWDVGEEILLNVPIIRYLYGFFRRKLSLPENYPC